MNLKSITKSAANLAVGAALTTGLAANAVAEGDLPEGYTKLDYVETTGSQYLDTGYYPTPKSILEARIQMFGEKLNTTVGSIFAAKEDQWAFTVNYGGEGNVTELYCWFYKGYKMNGSGWTTVEKFSVGDNNGKIVDLSFDSTTGMFKYGTASRTCTRPVHTFTKCPLFFGADVNSANLPDGEGGRLFSYFEASPFNYFRMRIYSLKLRDDELRRDYVPCQNERGEVGLYDRVNGTFSPSSSGVAFVPSENARFNVAVEVLGVGTVQVMADGEDVLGKSVPAGSTLDLSATPSEGYAFAGWSGNVFEKGYASDAETKTTRGISGAVCLTAVFLKVKDTWPADYERLEYVATTGTQYLVTGYCSNPSTRMDASVQMDGNPDVSKGVNIFGVREGRYSFTVNFGNTVETLDILRPWFDKLREAGGANRGFSGVNAFRGRRVSMGADATRGYFTYGDLTQSYCGPTTTWITGGSVVLAGFLNVDTGAVTPCGCYGMRIYGWSFSDGTTPMRDYVPCRRLADGVAGLYDRVSGTFCESSGEPFVAGDPWSGKEVVPSYVGYTPGELSYDYVFTSFVPPLSDFTANVWVKNVTPGSFKTGVNECIGTIVSQGALSANNGFCCFVRQIGGETTQKLVFQTRAPYHELEIDWTAQATDDIWHLITLTYDRTTQNKRLYVDGVCVGEATVDVPSPVSTEGVAIGARLSGGRPDFPMKGYFAEASVWNRALSAKEVRAMLYGSLRGTEQGLIGYWPMTDDRRITPDRVANGNVPHDGIFTGGSKKLVEDKVGFHKRPGTMLLVW